MSPPRARWVTPAVAGGTATLVGGVITNLAAEALGAELGRFGPWLAAAVVGGLILVALGAYLLSGRRGARTEVAEDAGEDLDVTENPLPPRVDLAGRDGQVAEAAARLRDYGFVVVHGREGVGASAVAIEAARAVVPEPDAQEYLDLRGPDPGRQETDRRVAIRVLTGLGVAPRRVSDLAGAAERVRQALEDSGRVLVLDNAVRPEQVAWLPRPIPGAYVVVAGSLNVRPLGQLPEVPVDPLDPDSALDLLRRQDGARRWGRGGRAEAARPGRAGSSIGRRIDAEPEVARELAQRRLHQPRAIIELGHWLAKNPEVPLRRFLVARGDAEPPSIIVELLRDELRGASAGARRLVGLFAGTGVADLREAAVVALSGLPAERTREHLEELAERALVERTPQLRYRVPEDTLRLGAELVRVPTRELRRAKRRLLAHLARTGAAYAAALRPDAPAPAVRQAEGWLRTEDATMAQALAMPAPPAAAAADLRSLADVLDLWFGRENRPLDRANAAEALAEAARRVGDEVGVGIGLLRQARLAQDQGRLDEAAACLATVAADPAGRRTRRRPCRPQLHTGQARQFAAIGDLAAATEEIQCASDARPRRGDEVGQVTDLVNLAAVELREAADQLAQRHLNEALYLAKEVGDTGGEAHALELLGIASWRLDQPKAALAAWQEAAALYDGLGDDEGQARCLLHQATALSTERDRHPEVAPLLRQSLERRAIPDTGLGVALTRLLLAQEADHDANPTESAHHRAAGLTALHPWEDRHPHPPEITQTHHHLTTPTNTNRKQ